jgi:hypothetical protein
MSAQMVFAAALIGLGLIATGPPARAAEAEAHLNGAAELRAAALVEERRAAGGVAMTELGMLARTTFTRTPRVLI